VTEPDRLWKPTRPARPAVRATLAAGLCAVVGATVACTPTTKEPTMNQSEAALIVRAEVRAMAESVGSGFYEYREKLIPCDAQLKGTSLTFDVNLRLRADPGKVAAIRSGLLAERERAGWRLRNDTTSDQVGWTIADSRGFHVGFNVFPSGEATVGGSGPCLPASAGTPSPSTWPDAR
jgi:hypothetical protein